MTSYRKKSPKNFLFFFQEFFTFCHLHVVFASKNHQVLFTVIYRNAVNNIYQKIVNFTVLRYVVLASSKIICHFENSQSIFTSHIMASMCAKFHSIVITPPPSSQIKYATPDTPNKIGLLTLRTYKSSCKFQSVRFLGPNIWALVPQNIKNCKFL